MYGKEAPCLSSKALFSMSSALCKQTEKIGSNILYAAAVHIVTLLIAI
jgi:hypothetical protein